MFTCLNFDFSFLDELKNCKKNQAIILWKITVNI